MTFSKRLVSTLCLSLGATAAVTAASTASAHGGFPRAFQVIVEPGNANDIVLRSDLWGFFRTQDAGKTWQWTCAEVYSSDSLSVNHNPVALAPGGRLFVGNSFKGLYYTDDGCAWTNSPAFQDKLLSDVQVYQGSVFVVTSTNTNTEAGVEGLVWKSTDNGGSFQKVGTPFPTNIAASSLGIAPSDPTRLYVLGRVIDSTPGTLLRSDNGGTTWKTSEIPTSDGFMTLRVAGVHPTKPDLLVVWADLKEELNQDSHDEIWVTPDAGTTWKKIYTGVGDLPGFAFSPDGTQVMIGGPKEGLQLAKLDDAIAGGQTAFTQDFTTPKRPTDKDRGVWGLHWDESGLLGGVDNFTARGVPAFMFGAWVDTDKDFSEMMSVCDSAFSACGAGTSVKTSCDRIFSMQGGFDQDYLKSTRCVPSSGADGGTKGNPNGATPAKDSGGCSVPAASGEESSSSSTWIAGGFLAALGLGRRRVRARRA